MNNYIFAALHIPIGWVGVLASERGIQRLGLPQTSPDTALAAIHVSGSNALFDPAHFNGLFKELTAYFSGENVLFDQSLDLASNPPFFQEAWKACRSIPRGETRSYSWLATKAGNPKALRAAGQAMARNPVFLITPCHRVISSNGSLYRYGGGLGLKQQLLNLERDL